MSSQNKIIWIDIGTHHGQEYKSIFSTNFYFYWKLFRRLIGSKFLRKGNFLSISSILKLIDERQYLRKNKDLFHFTFIEASQKTLHSKIYKKANDVFCVALGNELNKIKIGKLFHANNHETSQGNSIYNNKGNIFINAFTSCMIVDAEDFALSYKKYLDKQYDNYKVIIRVNCEGSEDDVIYGFHKIFDKNLINIFGSLKDVKSIKGEKLFNKLLNYMKKNNLSFVNFSSSVETWLESFSCINDILKK